MGGACRSGVAVLVSAGAAKVIVDLSDRRAAPADLAAAAREAAEAMAAGLAAAATALDSARDFLALRKTSST
jgi:hypothetical protein